MTTTTAGKDGSSENTTDESEPGKDTSNDSKDIGGTDREALATPADRQKVDTDHRFIPAFSFGIC